MRILPIWSTVVASMAFCSSVQALPAKPYLPLDLAQQAASTAVSHCMSAGFSVTVSVLDRAGEAIVFLRGDQAKPHHPAASRRKAYTALTFGMPSGELAPFIAAHPAASGLGDMEGVIALGGGLPIKSGDDIVGAIGVAGATGSDADVACARAGIDSIAVRLKSGAAS